MQNTTLMNRSDYDSWVKTLPKNIDPLVQWRDYQLILEENKYWVWIANKAPYRPYHTLLIPKRRVNLFCNLKNAEIHELQELIEKYTKLLTDLNLKHTNGAVITSFTYFWRVRAGKDVKDALTGTLRVNHFHVHILPDRDRSWDPLLEPSAYATDFTPILDRLSEVKTTNSQPTLFQKIFKYFTLKTKL